MGNRGAVSTVRHDVRRLEGEAGGISPRAASAGAAPRAGVPSPRRLEALAAIWPGGRAAEDQQALDAPCAGDETTGGAIESAEKFAAMVRARDPDGLSGWPGRAEGSSVPELRTIARGLRPDEAAVRASIRLPWSNIPVEGHVDWLKAIKRTMHGRARFDLLRARVLAAG